MIKMIKMTSNGLKSSRVVKKPFIVRNWGVLSMLLAEVPADRYFHAANGTVIRSVWELEPALEAMGQDTFNFHVDGRKNDFASWADDTLQDAELAALLRQANGRDMCRIAVLRRLVGVLRDAARI